MLFAKRKSEQAQHEACNELRSHWAIADLADVLGAAFAQIAVQGFTGAGEFFVIALLVCYAPGIIPLIAVAGLDELMSRYRVNVWPRTLVCGGIGFAAAYALFWYGAQAVGAQRDFAQYGMWLGLLGAVPAAVCSWLSSRNKTEALKA